MRILYALHGYKPAYRVGGPVHSVPAVAERLARRGHEVTVFTTNSNLDRDLDVAADRPHQVDGVNVWYFRHEEPLQKTLPFVPYLSKSMGFLYCPAMRAELDRLVPSVDLVHTHLPFVYPSLAAGRAALRFRKPLFYHQRGVFDPARLRFRSLKKRLYVGAVERPLMRRATTLFALTLAEVASYRAIGVGTPCRVIPNGVDIAQPPWPWRAAEGPLRFADDDLVILFMARLHPIKGADRLVRAFLAIHGRMPNAKLVLAGPDEWGMAASLGREIAAAGAGEKVFFPGLVSGEEKQRLLARADLFCLPSDAEGFSVAVLEALANGMPALLSPGCHFPEAEAAGAAVVVEPEPSRLAEALSVLLKDKSHLAVMGRRGRDLVARRYSWDAIVDDLEEAYLEGIDRHKLGLG